MPTYGMENIPDPQPGMPDIESAVEAALRVRDECRMALSDTAVTRLVTSVLITYHEALTK